MYTVKISIDESKFATVLESIDSIASRSAVNIKKNIMSQLLTVSNLYSCSLPTKTIYIIDRYNSPLALLLISLLEEIKLITNSDTKDIDISEAIAEYIEAFKDIVIGRLSDDEIKVIINDRFTKIVSLQ
jgi:hypothetical protein